MKITGKFLNSIESLYKEIQESNSWVLKEVLSRYSRDNEIVKSFEMIDPYLTSMALLDVHFSQGGEVLFIRLITAWSGYEYKFWESGDLQYVGAFNGFLHQRILPYIWIDYDSLICVSSTTGDTELSWEEACEMKQEYWRAKERIIRKYTV